MSIELSSVGQQITAMDRRLEGSANTTQRNTPVAKQTTRPDETLKQAQLAQIGRASCRERV